MNDYTKQQQEAIDHLREWRVGALFMEPGTGKTRAAMTLINSTDCSDCFWIGPLRTFPAIQMEMAKWGGMRMPTSCWGVESLSMSDQWIMKEIGMDADELLRFKQLSGLAELFKDKEFSKAKEL